MSEEIIVQYGSPTLAGIKTGNLFTCPFKDRGQTMRELRRLNRELVPKGLRVLPLRYSDKRVLVYLYRPDRLEKDLSAAEAADLLEQAGCTFPQLIPDETAFTFIRSFVSGFPTTVFLDSNGKIIGSTAGSRSAEEWLELIGTYLDSVS